MTRAGLVALTALLAGSARIHAQAPGDNAELPPPGFGTLRQDEVALRLTAVNVELRVLPLDERVTRLLSPDTWSALSRLPQMRAAEIERLAVQNGVRRPVLLLVTFFGREPRARFTPEDLTVTSQNRLFRPVAIQPLSVQWSALALEQRETASAIYLFEEGLAVLEPFTVTYGAATTSQWEQTLRLLEKERARAYSRSAAVRG